MPGSAVVLLDHNRLSCRLPADIAVPVRASLVAVGNHLTWSGKDEALPSYVSQFERDGLFWFKDSTAMRIKPPT